MLNTPLISGKETVTRPGVKTGFDAETETGVAPSASGPRAVGVSGEVHAGKSALNAVTVTMRRSVAGNGGRPWVMAHVQSNNAA
jgi:hypothetical protein